MDKRPGSAPGSVRGPRLTPGQLNDLAKILRLFLKKNNKHHHHHATRLGVTLSCGARAAEACAGVLLL